MWPNKEVLDLWLKAIKQQSWGDQMKKQIKLEKMGLRTHPKLNRKKEILTR